MIEVTARCGCGRPMRADTFAGPGRYRCSCGARVALSGLPRESKTRCSVIKGGRMCNGPKPEDSMVCQPCAIGITRIALLDPEIVEVLADYKAKAQFGQEVMARMPRLREESEAESERFFREQRERMVSVVYYCRLRPDVVKIGTTVALSDRMRALRVYSEDLLAVEPGAYDLEAKRHRQFDHLRINPRREDFTLGEDLQAHIDDLVATLGPPLEVAARPVLAGPGRES